MRSRERERERIDFSDFKRKSVKPEISVIVLSLIDRGRKGERG